MRRVTLGLLTVAVLSVAGGPLVAQELARSVNQVRDGFVRMSFTAREGVCGHSNGIYTSRTNDEHWESYCEGGPVRVVLDRRSGTTRDIDTHVGGRWKARNDVVDLGTVPAPEAAAFFMSLARVADADVAGDAIFAAALADSVTLWPGMMVMARDTDLQIEVRKKALFWAAQLGDNSVVGMLNSFIRSDANRDLREHAIFGLSQHDSEESVRSLRVIVEDGDMDSKLRERAIFWLGQKHGESHGYLRRLYDTVSDRNLKERIIFAVSQRADDEDWDWLLARAAADSESIELRKKAMFWAGQSRRDMSDLIDLYDRLDSRELKENLLFVFSQNRRDEDTLNKLFDVARNEMDSRLRGRAIFWLGQSRDPRAIEFLAELIG